MTHVLTSRAARALGRGCCARVSRSGLVATLVVASLAAPSALAQDNGVDICIARSDGSYAAVTVLESELGRYRGGRNLVPAPAGGCPGRSRGSGGDGSSGSATPPVDAPSLAPAAPATPTVTGPDAARIGEGGTLPNTGAEPLLVCLLGAGFVLCGVGLRLRTRHSW